MTLAGCVALVLIAAPGGRSVLAELQGIDRQLTTAEERLLSLERRQAALRDEMARIETDLAATRVRKRDALADYARRIRALAQMPEGSRMILLGGSRSLADYLDASRVLRWVAGHDRRLQQHYLAQSQELSGLEAQLHRRQQEQGELVETARLERDRLAQRRQERLGLLDTVATSGELRALAAREDDEATRDLGRVVSGLGRAERPGRAGRGRMAWPASGSVDVSFGQKVERSFGTVTAHNGIDIRATSGSPVVAVAPGRVVFADWLKGYGQLVIVAHADHLHSLMAHLGRIEVQVGREVEAGATLGTVGDSGSLRGTVLYFELRERGTPIDPMPWLIRR